MARKENAIKLSDDYAAGQTPQGIHVFPYFEDIDGSIHEDIHAGSVTLAKWDLVALAVHFLKLGDLLAERDALRAALADLESAAESTSRLLSRLSVIAFNDNADNDLPYGLAEEVRAWVRDTGIDKALEQARAALDAEEEAA